MSPLQAIGPQSPVSEELSLLPITRSTAVSPHLFHIVSISSSTFPFPPPEHSSSSP